MSEITKRAFASSLKKMLAKRPLEKIRVIDITEDCGVNRQTFYYHFKDIYDLLEWVYTNEATKALGGKKTYETWKQGFKQIFQYILNNKEFTLNADHIEKIEEVPETLITLTNGKKYIVLETIHEVKDKVIRYKNRIATYRI